MFADSRIVLDQLEESNELVVDADCEYTNSGEGLHRFVDPVDDEVYLYTQFEVPDSRRVFAVFEQPDLKATFQFTVTAPRGGRSSPTSRRPSPSRTRARRIRDLGIRADPAHLVVHHRHRRRAVRRGPR